MTLLLAIALMVPVPPHAVVVKPVANMYSAASEDADVVSQAIFGSGVVLIEDQGDWVKVRTPDDYTGWMRRDTLRIENGDHTYASTSRAVQVASLSANVYREPSITKHVPLLNLPFEARLESAPQQGYSGSSSSSEWLQVRLPDERLAWIQKGDVESEPAPLNLEGDIELAKRFIGITYLWGGTSSFGFDCSGFTQMLVRRRGVVMPRDADVQAVWKGVEPVKRSQLRAGDLLFFGKSPQKITHTGMYIGHGKFIHDTTHQHPGVQISRLADEHWTKLLVACRRLK